MLFFRCGNIFVENEMTIGLCRTKIRSFWFITPRKLVKLPVGTALTSQN